MASLQSINGRASYIPGVNNLGIVLTDDGGAVVIDTGIDKDTGRLIRKLLDEAGLRLRAIINTHHHADHIGGNDFLLRNILGVEVYAPPLEAALIEHPLLEPLYLSMGAQPIPALQTKWLMSKGSRVDHLIDGVELRVAGLDFEVLSLPGHSLNQIGLVIDDVCYAADGFFGPDTLQKHGIPYAQNIAQQLASLQRLSERSEQWFLPGHGDLYRSADLVEVLTTNRAAVERSSQVVQAALTEPGDLAAVGRRVQQLLGLNLQTLPQYAIFLSAVSAHLGYLEAQGLAMVAVGELGIVWQRR